MPARMITRADKEIISSQPVSPCTNRSGLTCNQSLVWSPETTLRDVTNKAHRNMTKINQEINDSSQKTPGDTVNENTSTPRTPISDGVNVTPHSIQSVRVKNNTPSPTVISASATKSTPKSPAEETTKIHRTVIEPENFNYDSDSESSFDQQEWKDNVQNADSSAYRKRMAEDDWGPNITDGDFEGLQQESSVERTHRIIQSIQRRQEAESRVRSRSPATPRSASRDSSASRNSSADRSADRNGARPRNYSGNSVDMEGDYSSGQEYFSAGEEEK